MIKLNELKSAVAGGIKILEKKSDLQQSEVFASFNRHAVMRLCYATNVPSNALEEPKSMETFGLSVRALFKNGKIGFGKSDSELSKSAVEEAYENAKRNAVHDNDFHGFPSPAGKAKLRNYSDKKIASLDDKKAIDLSYVALNGALDYLAKKRAKTFNITGELDFILDRIAIANSNGILATDENTSAIATLTTIIEGEIDVTGTWFDSSTHMKDIKPYETGRISAEKAISGQNPGRIESGTYKAVLSSNAVAEIIYSRLSLGLDEVDSTATPFLDKLDKKVAVDELSISDNAILPKAICSKAITDEGLPATKTPLIERGKLVNYLSNHYFAKKYSDDKRYNARNGFRLSQGGRHYYSEPSVYPTNIVVEPSKFNEVELVKEVKNGIYVGRIWYTYPVNGAASADFTGTIRGDSYIIKNGKIISPLVPNTCRINDNLERIFMAVKGIGKKSKIIQAWGQDWSIVTPEIAIDGLKIERIAKGLY